MKNLGKCYENMRFSSKYIHETKWNSIITVINTMSTAFKTLIPERCIVT